VPHDRLPRPAPPTSGPWQPLAGACSSLIGVTPGPGPGRAEGTDDGQLAAPPRSAGARFRDAPCAPLRGGPGHDRLGRVTGVPPRGAVRAPRRGRRLPPVPLRVRRRCGRPDVDDPDHGVGPGAHPPRPDRHRRVRRRTRHTVRRAGRAHGGAGLRGRGVRHVRGPLRRTGRPVRGEAGGADPRTHRRALHAPGADRPGDAPSGTAAPPVRDRGWRSTEAGGPTGGRLPAGRTRPGARRGVRRGVQPPGEGGRDPPVAVRPDVGLRHRRPGPQLGRARPPRAARGQRLRPVGGRRPGGQPLPRGRVGRRAAGVGPVRRGHPRGVRDPGPWARPGFGPAAEATGRRPRTRRRLAVARAVR